MLVIDWLTIYSLVSLVIHLSGIASAIHAVMNVRSSRGAIAWGISLITFPWVTIPLYLLLGRNRFYGYAETLRDAYFKYQSLADNAYENIIAHRVHLQGEFIPLEKLATTFEAFPFTSNNAIELLIDGEQTFGRMLDAISAAKHYILLQSYIIHSDDIGHQFKDALAEKAKQGIKVYLLYDGLGSRKLSRQYLNDLRQSGVIVRSFRSTKGRRNRFQVNFRNHRKILVVDGRKAFMGGLNIGDECLGKHSNFGDWRDTHVQFQGTAVQCLQGILVRDLFWAGTEAPETSWEVQKENHYHQTAFILSTGPADRLQECLFFFLHLINQTQTRLWIASPYFVPDSATLNALKMAALRGVDVRILLPDRPDHLSVYFCAFSFYQELEKVGIKLYRYQSGFMHQKVILCDDAIAGIGTVNLDNRSFYLNFEVMSFVIEQQQEKILDATESDFIQTVEQMLNQDMERSRLVDYSEYQRKPFWFKLVAKVARLLAPVL